MRERRRLRCVCVCRHVVGGGIAKATSQRDFSSRDEPSTCYDVISNKLLGAQLLEDLQHDTHCICCPAHSCKCNTVTRWAVRCQQQCSSHPPPPTTTHHYLDDGSWSGSKLTFVVGVLQHERCHCDEHHPKRDVLTHDHLPPRPPP